ncbi:hypothetical protein EV360DRAFT_80871 [Lentinula raphanica]|nr:hypothetical protein EV360DRAFT_80871 [Lentinula raphanica]
MSLTIDSIEIDERSDDDILEQIQPSPELLSSLKIHSTTSVSNLLSMAMPNCPGSRRIYVKDSEWFSKEEPNSELDLDPALLVIPSLRQSAVLDGEALRKAVKQKCRSVRHPVKDNVLLPLGAVRAWKWAGVLLGSKLFWEERLKWVEQTAAKEEWCSDLLSASKCAILQSPWQLGTITGRGNIVSIRHVAEILLSSSGKVPLT